MLSPLSRFGVLWAFALLHHQLGYGVAAASATDLLLTGLSALCIVFPRTGLLAAMSGAHLLTIGRYLPAVFNHWFFSGLVSAGLLLALAIALLRARVDHTPSMDSLAYDAFAPAARLSLLALYFITGFHKLNSDFLSAGVSCATVLTQRLADNTHLASLTQAPESIAIVLTLLTELGVPLLLVASRTRRLGLVLALGFHVVMALAGYPRFSSTGTALLTLFLVRPTPLGIAEPAMSSVGIRLLVVAAAGVTYLMGREASHIFTLIVLLAVVIGTCQAAWSMSAPTQSLFRWQRWSMASWALPVGVLALGCAPYLGLHTDRVWSMYSNLRTEGGQSNHLLLSSTWQPVGAQRALVAVESSSAPRLSQLARDSMQVPWVEFRTRVHEALSQHGGQVEVTYNLSGNRRVVPNAATDEQLGQPVSRLVRKLFRFRAIEVRGARQCSV